ncbi:hypothetical protein SG34_023660 [Thalassomonas viridans]|uniref:Uncharacterized protein n=1 Tax=Thalassomonas viridans TaxID=137584 RepID=A0AAE9Z0I3_9GAMM|nr:DUF6289 family protein [Thalassomonas viridans]WDE04308.1 hypothetical protein SG34_023660 [Thalassomonas viridans]
MKTSMKKLLTAGAAAATIFTASYAYAAFSILEFVYYSDSSYSTVVGERVDNQCTGSTYTSGTVTPYVRIVGSEPCGRHRL